MEDVDTSDEIETSDVPCSFGHLIDPAQALQAAQRLYAAPGPGICHSGWEGWTVDRKRAATQRSKRAEDNDNEPRVQVSGADQDWFANDITA